MEPAITRPITDVSGAVRKRRSPLQQDRTVVRLFEFGVQFVSRSEAKRLMRGLERFQEVLVDFTGIEEVGQGFVDEVVRVWPGQHPGTTVEPVNMSGPVEFMVRRGLPPPTLRRQKPEEP